MSLAELKARYFITAADVPGGSRVPRAFDGSVATELIDADEYFAAFFKVANDLTGAAVPSGGKTYRDFIYIANWNFESAMPFPDPRSSAPDLLHLLATKAQIGVDVRVLVWLGAWSIPDQQSAVFRSALSNPEKAAKSLPHREVVRTNLESARWLRSVTALKRSVLLDFGAHMFGAHHMKVASIYDATKNTLVSFCGGIDFDSGRAGSIGHAIHSPLLLPPSPDPAGVSGGLTIPVPSVSPGAAGTLPAGVYEVRVAAIAVHLDTDRRALLGLSPVATVTLPAPARIAVTGVAPVMTPAGYRDLERVVFARDLGQAMVPKWAGVVPTGGATSEVDGPVSAWGKELAAWEWHDVAVKLEGEAAGDVTSLIVARWNAVVKYPPFKLFDPRTPRQLGEANPRRPQATLPAPTVTATAGGALVDGDYEVAYSVAADLGAIRFFLLSDVARVRASAGGRLDVAAIPTATKYEPHDAPLTITERVLWARHLSDQAELRRVAVIPLGDVSATIASAPATWAPELPTADYVARPLPGISESLPASVPPPTGTQSIQVLATIADVDGLLSWLSGTTQKYGFAPHGEFTTFYGYAKAIAAARRYIFIEDQVMGPAPLMMGLIAERLTTPGAPLDLKVLLLTSGAFDPADGEVTESVMLGWNEGVYEALLEQLPAALRRNVRLFRSRGLTTHSKVMIVDDEWAAVGSANIFDRSFSTDTELQTVVVDEVGAFPRTLRKRLWAEHLSIAPGDAAYARLDDIDMALYMWDRSWGTSPGVPFPDLRRANAVTLPIPGISAPIPPTGAWVKKLAADWRTVSLP